MPIVVRLDSHLALAELHLLVERAACLGLLVVLVDWAHVLSHVCPLLQQSSSLRVPDVEVRIFLFLFLLQTHGDDVGLRAIDSLGTFLALMDP